MTKREYRFDNAKFILILLVVFGHILEHFQGRYVPGIYRTVYLFHMPMFIFISGYFAKFDRKKNTVQADNSVCDFPFIAYRIPQILVFPRNPL